MLKVNKHTKYSLIAAIAALAAMGQLYKLKNLLNEVLEQAFTIDELTSALSYLISYIGQPRALNSFKVLKTICAQKRPNITYLVEQEINKAFIQSANRVNNTLSIQCLLAIKLGALAVDDSFACQLEEHLITCLNSQLEIDHINTIINSLATKADIDVAMRANASFAKLLTNA